MSRTTIYKVFGGKEQVRLALLDASCPTIGAHFAAVNLGPPGLGLLAVELAAALYVEDEELPVRLERAAAVLGAVGRAKLLPISPKVAAGAIQGKLPRGKHRLPRLLVKENQRRRLLLALAADIAGARLRTLCRRHIDRGWCRARVLLPAVREQAVGG